LLVVLATILFMVFPGIEIRFSGLFYDPATASFPIAGLEAFQLLRESARIVLIAIIVTMLGAVAIKLLLPARRTLLDPRAMLFVTTALVAAPGIVVNVILKPGWSRPRPYMVEAFGDDMPFVRAWDMSGACSGNCSFVSGEASSAVWMLTLMMLVPLAWRGRALAVLATLAVLYSLNRIAFGGHFLSDVVIAWGLTLAIIAALHRTFYFAPPAVLGRRSLEHRLTRAGLRLRRLLRGRAR
ncbi:MAG: phosphatase PAP2 family protein, partial [Alphaproteobacteria bacterium]